MKAYEKAAEAERQNFISRMGALPEHFPGMYWVLDDDGRTPIETDMFGWHAWREEDRYRVIVAKTNVGEFRVSTVFLGNNHNFFDEGAPILFETMVFGKDDTRDRDMERYETYEQAEAGHAAMVAKVEAGVAEWKKFCREHRDRLVPLKYERYEDPVSDEMREWLGEHIEPGTHRYVSNSFFGEALVFDRSEDAIHFKLRWK